MVWLFNWNIDKRQNITGVVFQIQIGYDNKYDNNCVQATLSDLKTYL